MQTQGAGAYKRKWLDTLMTWCGPKRDTIRPAVRAMLQDWSAWQPLHIEAHVLLDTPVAPLLARTQVPVLVLIGRDDMAGSQNSSRALLAADPKAHAVYLENAGHLSNMENPKAFNQAIETFWNNL